MPVCKFYLQGNCRYGNNCNFDHPRNQQNYQNQQYRQDYRQENRQDYRQSQQHQSQNQVRYQSYNVPQNQQRFRNDQYNYQQTKSPPPSDGQNLTDQDFLNHMRNELSDWINSSAWKLSCYSYSRLAPCIPILQDISEEEVRFSLYEAKKNNTYTQACNEYMNKLNQTTNTIKQMINPDQQTREYLLKYFRESEQIIKTGKEQEETSKNPDNPFAKIAQQQQSRFQTTNSLSNLGFQQPQQQQQTSFFAPAFQPPQQTNQNQQNFFAQIAHKQQTQQSTFGQGFQAQQPSFGQSFITQQNQPPLFNLATNQNTHQINGFSQQKQVEPSNFFSQVVNMNTTSNQPLSNTFFGLQPGQMNTNTNDTYYTPMEDIRQSDLDEFKSDHFTIGRIPNIPPARELC